MIEIQRQYALGEILTEVLNNTDKYTLGGEFHDDSGNVLGRLIKIPELLGRNFDVPVSKTRRLSSQPRINFDGLTELAESLQTHQDTNVLLVPVLTNDRTEIIFAILDGERRQRASIMIGKESLRADFEYRESETEMSKDALFSVLGRENLTPIEEARGLSSVLNKELQQGRITTKEIIDTIAKRAAMTTTLVEQRLGLLKLPDALQDMLLKDQITLTSAQKFLNSNLTGPQVTVLIVLLKRRLNEIGKINTNGFDQLLGKARLAGGETSIGNGLESGSNILKGKIENRISNVRDRVGEIMADLAAHPELYDDFRLSIEKLLESVIALARATEGSPTVAAPTTLKEKPLIESAGDSHVPKLEVTSLPTVPVATNVANPSHATKKTVAPSIAPAKRMKLSEYIIEHDEQIRTILPQHHYEAFKLIADKRMTMSDLMAALKATFLMDFVKSRVTFVEDVNAIFKKQGLKIILVNVDEEYGVAYLPEYR